MTADFFTQLEAELGGLTHEGVHLGDASARQRRRLGALARRGLAILALAVALAASLDSEFPATASGYAPVAQVATVQDA